MITAMELVATLLLDSSAFESGLENASKTASGIGDKLGSGLKAAVGIGAAALTATTGAAVAFGKTAVDAGSQFDSAMSQVAATMGKSTDEITDLRDFAKEMGATTAFSATQAAEALNYMALAGYDSETAMRMLPTVLNLAAAGGMDLASASDMVTDTQSALGLSIEETERMVDQMAKTSQKTNTSVSQLGDAMLTIGATARSINGGTSELSAVLGVLADNGTKAGEGGTHLRNILMALQTPSEKGAKALEQLGMSYDDMYNEAGEMRSIPEIIQEMATAMDGMNQQSKDAIVSGIFNTTDLAAVNALLGTSAERWRELEVQISNADGAAEDMSNTQLDNLAGDMELFRSALEGAQLEVSDKLTPSIREFVQLGTNALSEITLGFQSGGLRGAVEAFGKFLSDGLTLIAEKLPMVVDAGAQIISALIRGIGENVPLLADGAVQIATSFAQMLIDTLPSLTEAAAELVAQLSVGIGDALPELVPAAVEAILSFAQSLIDNTDSLVEGALAIITGLAEGIINSIPVVVKAIPKIIDGIVKALIQSIPKIGTAGGELLGGLVRDFPKVLPGILLAVASIIGSIIEAIVEGGASMVEAGINLIAGLAKGLLDGAVNVINQAKQVASNVLGAIKGFFGIASPSRVMRKEVGQMLSKGLIQGMEDEYGNLRKASDEISEIITPDMDISGTINGLRQEMGNLGGLDISSGIDRVINVGQASQGHGVAGNEAMLARILDAIQQMSITLDGRAVVGYLTPYIDSELGRIYNQRVREATYV